MLAVFTARVSVESFDRSSGRPRMFKVYADSRFSSRLAEHRNVKHTLYITLPEPVKVGEVELRELPPIRRRPVVEGGRVKYYLPTDGNPILEVLWSRRQRVLVMVYLEGEDCPQRP